MNRVVLIGIIVENMESAAKLNAILHYYSEYVLGRMGIPNKDRKISIISVAVDAPDDIISAMSGKIGMLDGVSTKTIYTKVKDDNKTAD